MAIYNATTGVDAIIASGDPDTIVITTDSLQLGDSFNGAYGFDTVLLSAAGAGTHNFDLTLATFAEIEAVQFSGVAGATLIATINADQIDDGNYASTVRIVGSDATDLVIVNLEDPRNYYADPITFQNWTDGVDIITFNGSWQQDEIRGTAYADVINGGNGEDELQGGGGNDIIDGGEGPDTAIYVGPRANYYVYATDTGLVVVDRTGAEGVDTLIGIQTLRFSDGEVSASEFTTNNAPTASTGGNYYIQAGDGVAITGTAGDADLAEGDAISYAWDLDNDGQFDDSTSLTLNLTADDLAALGIDGVGDHTISLRVIDASGAVTIATSTLTVGAVTAPVITSDGGDATAAVSVAENTTAVTTVVATDANLDDTVTYAISGGADAALFAIDANTGVLTFVGAPDHDAAGDADGDNVYEVIVEASDGTLTDTQTISVTVTDAADAVVGTAGDDVMVANGAGGSYDALGGNDTVTGSAVDDVVTGGAGNDTIDGGDGADTAVFSGNLADYYIYTDGAATIVLDRSGADGVDTLTNVETLQFADGSVANTGFSANEAPTASTGGDYYIQAGDGVAITGTAGDADLAEGDAISYAWDLDNDGEFDDSTSLNLNLTAGDLTALGIDGVGDHTISLRVVDATGAVTIATSTLTVAAVAAPVITSDGGDTTAAVSVVENTTAVTTVVATDANLDDTVTYSISGGADAALFAIDANTGELTFVGAPDHDAAGDADGDNVYDVIVQASDGTLTDTQTLAVTVTDAADAVVGTVGDDVMVANVAGGSYDALGGNDTVTGSAVDDVVTGGAGNDAIDGGDGADTAVFSGNRADYYIYTDGGTTIVLDRSGADGVDTLTNIETLQFADGSVANTGFSANEAPTADAGGSYYVQEGLGVALTGTAADADVADGDVISVAWDLDNDGQFDDAVTLSPTLSHADLVTLGIDGVGDHTVTLQVTDAAGAVTTSSATLTIAASVAPVISSDGGGDTASASVAENTTAVTTVVAADGNLNDTVTYSISGGADAALFTIDPTTGALAFVGAPNYEAPADADANNVYEVIVQASDGALVDTQTITVTVTDTYDLVVGTAGDDVMIANPAGGIYQGLDGADAIMGSALGDTLRGGGGEDVLCGGEGADIVDGGAGFDAASYQDSSAGVTVRLWNGTGSGGSASGDTLIDIESAIGSSFADVLVGAEAASDTLIGLAGDDILQGVGGNDTLVGGEGNDHLIGGSGSDVLDGGLGNDVASYAASTAGVTVRLWNGTGVGGHAEGDALINIENVVGSSYRDALVGNDYANTLDGGAGNDFLYGLNGQDTLVGSAGADILDGGEGIDTASYAASSVGVIVRLWNGTGVGGHAEGDTLTSVENLVGSALADTLVGSENQANTLEGGAGNDILQGLSGADVLVGGAGNDTLIGGSDADILNGGVGSDTASYATSTAGVTIRLWNGTGVGGHAEGDTLIDIENVVGSAFSDTLVGSVASNTLQGGQGRDHLYGLSGSDTLLGGAGDDRLHGGEGRDVLNGAAGSDDFVFASYGSDHWDAIDGFYSDDEIWLDVSVFTSLTGAGPLDASMFRLGAVALDANDHVIYDASTGALYYDVDGAGGAAQLQIALLSAGSLLSAEDIILF